LEGGQGEEFGEVIDPVGAAEGDDAFGFEFLGGFEVDGAGEDAEIVDMGEQMLLEPGMGGGVEIDARALGREAGLVANDGDGDAGVVAARRKASRPGAGSASAMCWP